jgi:hypothetical protein
MHAERVTCLEVGNHVHGRLGNAVPEMGGGKDQCLTTTEESLLLPELRAFEISFVLLSAKTAAELDLGKLSGKNLFRFFVADPHEIDPGYKLWIPSASIVPVIRILHLVPFNETGHPPA